MTDPVVQDTNEYHEKLARFNRAVEAVVPIVREKVTEFEGFLMDEYSTYFEMVNNTDQFLCFVNNLPKDAEIRVDWDNYVLEEAKRRVEG